MPVARADFELAMVDRCGGFMVVSGIAATPAADAAPRAYLAGVVADALMQLGLPVSSVAAPTQDDLDRVPDDQQSLLLLYGELRLIRNCLGKYTDVDFAGDLSKTSSDQLRKGMQARVEDILEDLRTPVGSKIPRPAVGRTFAQPLPLPLPFCGPVPCRPLPGTGIGTGLGWIGRGGWPY